MSGGGSLILQIHKYYIIYNMETFGRLEFELLKITSFLKFIDNFFLICYLYFQ